MKTACDIMAARDIGKEILEGIREIKAHKAGKVALRTRELREPAPSKVIRGKLGLSQTAFAGLMGVSPRTVQDWEQGRRKPREHKAMVPTAAVSSLHFSYPEASRPPITAKS